ncbi:MAG: protein kinase [Acidobacteria bacterium]|nr:protein kinase [Acidobacteriota bacterium]
MELKSGDTFGGYRIVRSLGAGAFADVYLAADPSSGGREIALKIIREDCGEAMEERGASLLQTVDHPNIVKVHFVGRIEGCLAVVMEYVPGKTLRQVLHRSRVLPEERALAIAAQIAEAVDYLHSLRIGGKQGVAHLDLKPSNILLDPDDHTRITDFSTARLGVSGATTTGCGSPAYMAPEQFQGHPVLASDLWAIGVILFEMVQGRSFFRGKSVEEYRALATGDPARWSDRVATLPSRSRAAVQRCIVKEPSERCSARELTAMLRDFLADGETGVCPECGAVLPEDGFCPECTGKASASLRARPLERLDDLSAPGAPGPFPACPAALAHEILDGQGATGDIPDWASRSIATHPVGPPTPGRSAALTATPGPAATPPRHRGRVSRLAGFLVLFLVMGGVAFSLWFLLNSPSGLVGKPTPAASPEAPGPGETAPGAVGEAGRGLSAPATVTPAPLPAPETRGGRRPDEAAAPAPELPPASPPGPPPRPAPGKVESPPPAAAERDRPPAISPLPKPPTLPLPRPPSPSTEECRSRLNRIKALESTTTGTYDDRIRQLEAYLADCGRLAGRADAEMMLRVWKWEKNAFQKAEDIDTGSGTRICEAVDAWRTFIQTARTPFRKPYAEERLRHWSNRLARFTGTVEIRVVSASNLPLRDTVAGNPASPDPYFVVLRDDIAVYRSRTLLKNNAPVWDEGARIQITPQSRITLEVWDQDPLDDDRLLRFKIFPLPEDGPYSARTAGATVNLIIERER